MSSTSQVTDFSDLYTDLLNRIRADTGQSTSVVQAKRSINIALQDMHIGFREGMSWAERESELRTHEPYSTGTLTASKGSLLLLGSGTAWNTSNSFGETNLRAGGRIVIDGGVEVYEISSVGSDTAAVLTSSFVKTGGSGLSYQYFEDEVALHVDFLRPLSLTSFDISDQIKLIGRNEFRARYPRNKTTGRPTVGTLVDKPFSGGTTPVRKIKLHQPPDDAYLIRYPFITNKLAVSSAGIYLSSMSSDDDEPIVPLPYRHAIVFHALYHWYRDKKDDQRSQLAKGEYVEIMTRITGDQENGRPRPRFKANVSPYKAVARSPYRSGTRSRHSLGTAFDELRD